MRYFLSIFFSLVCLASSAQENYLLVGTYDSPKSEGIYVYKFNSTNGSAKELSHIKTSNPSFLTVSPDQRFVYAVNENADSTGKGGGISSFSFNKKDGILKQLNQRSSEGNNPCYISIDNTGKWLAAGNYSSGNLVVYQVLSDGYIGTLSDSMQYSGKGYNETRQKGPHVHTTVFTPDGKFLAVTDLGLDKLMIYPFDNKNGKLNRANCYNVYSMPGTGPRHIAFHPSGKFLYIINELSSLIDVFELYKGKLQPIQTETSMPSDYSGPAGSADIHVSPDGKFLYASNRAESNSIAIFSIDKKKGILKLVGHQSTLGKTPRNFNFDPTGNYLLVGNQNSDEIVIFKRNLMTGLLTDTGNRIAVGKPVCIKWIKAN